MIWTVFATNVRRLWHNRIELLLMLVVPVIFFSIFALIFGRGVGGTPRVKVVLVDEADTALSHRIADSIANNPGLRPVPTTDVRPRRRDDAEGMVRRGGATLAIVLKRDPHDESIYVELLTDASDQVAGQVVQALVTRTLAVESARAATPERHARAAEPQTLRKVPVVPYPRTDGPTPFAAAAFRQPFPESDNPPPDNPPPDDPPRSEAVQMIDILGTGRANPTVSMYAAGIAVMFLLFGATTGGGVLLEEKESQTLDRLLSTRLTMDQLLLGKWFYLTLTGVLQVSVMFLWGQFVFGIDLLRHLDGFLIMTAVTSAAAAAFGLLMATLCRTRGQLNALSVIIVLTMSALGGSMVPRYVMSPELQQAGLWTFNAWALDGYDKVFWRELPVAELAPQLGVLLACAFAFLVSARMLAIRWEAD